MFIAKQKYKKPISANIFWLLSNARYEAYEKYKPYNWSNRKRSLHMFTEFLQELNKLPDGKPTPVTDK